MNQHTEQPNQDGHLNYQRPQAAYGVDPGLSIQAHGFLGSTGPVTAVPRLDVPHLGLQGAHDPHLPDLLQGKGHGDCPNKDSQQDDCDAHLVEANHIQYHQGIEHGPDDYFVPEDKDEFQSSTLEPAGVMPGLRASAGLVALIILGMKTPHQHKIGSGLDAPDGAILGCHEHGFIHCGQRGKDLRVSP